MKTNILYFIPKLKQEHGGVRQYAVSLLNQIALLSSKGFKFYVYHDRSDPLISNIIHEHSNLKLIKSEEFKYSYVFEKVINRFVFILNKYLLKHFRLSISFFSIPIEQKISKKYNIDIIHVPYQYLPEVNSAKCIITMHDVQELHFPKYFNSYERVQRAVNFKKYIENSNAIIVSYEHVKKDIIEYFDTNPNKVTVLKLSMDDLWIKKYVCERDKYSIQSEEYLFYPANAWEHKNHINLFRAIQELKLNKFNIVVYLSGNFSNATGNKLKKYVDDHDLGNNIIFKGIVDEESLFRLYVNALGVVIPTKYEAGSFPLVESIMLDIPVICSNITSLPETICNSNYLFDPYDIESIKEKLIMLWTNNSYRKESISNSKKIKNKLSNYTILEEIEELYLSLLE